MMADLTRPLPTPEVLVKTEPIYPPELPMAQRADTQRMLGELRKRSRAQARFFRIGSESGWPPMAKLCRYYREPQLMDWFDAIAKKTPRDRDGLGWPWHCAVLNRVGGAPKRGGRPEFRVNVQPPEPEVIEETDEDRAEGAAILRAFLKRTPAPSPDAEANTPEAPAKEKVHVG